VVNLLSQARIVAVLAILVVRNIPLSSQRKQSTCISSSSAHRNLCGIVHLRLSLSIIDVEYFLWTPGMSINPHVYRQTNLMGALT